MANKDTITHTTTSTSGVLAATLLPDGRFSFTFNTSGTYHYSCTIHPSMTGLITVTG